MEDGGEEEEEVEDEEEEEVEDEGEQEEEEVEGKNNKDVGMITISMMYVKINVQNRSEFLLQSQNSQNNVIAIAKPRSFVSLMQRGRE